MFCFCCPLRKSNDKKNGIDEKLIQVNENSPGRIISNSPTRRLAMSQSDKKILSSSISQKSLPLSHSQAPNNHNKEFISPMNNTQLAFNNDQTIIAISDPNPSGIQPRFEYIPPQPTSPLKNKSELYQLEHNTQVIYFDSKKEDEFCIRYLINKKPHIERQSKSILNYVLSKKSSSDHQNYELVLVIPSKVMYQTKHLHIPQHIHAIFTNMRRPQKSPSTNSTQIIEIIQGDYGSIRTQAFDKIIVILQGEQDPAYIKSYCTQLCKRYSLQQFIKIWWVFPSFMGIEDITDIIKQTLRKFLVSERIQQAAKYLFYEIDLVKQLNLEPFVIVKNKQWKQATIKKFPNNSNKLSLSTSLSLSTKEPSLSQTVTIKTANYQTQICLAMGLLMVEMNQNVMSFYKYFLQNVLQQMKLIDYMKYKSLLQNQKENFFKKLLFYNLLTEEGCKILEENNKIIEHKYYNTDHRRFTIKHSVKKKFIAAFGFQDSVQTGQNSTPVQQQWDDQLRLQDLKTRKCSWEKQQEENDENDLNLIDEEEIENIMIEELMFESDARERQEGTYLGDNVEEKAVYHSVQYNNEKKQNNNSTEEEELRIQILETKQL